MATPAILLFTATCVAQFISVIQGNNNNVVNQNNRGMIRATRNNAVVDSSSLASADENYDVGEVGHDHKRHHKNLVPPHRKKSSHHEDHENGDNGFDFYVFSSK
jgi:hypothetical protein